MNGKMRRLARLGQNGKYLFVPMDHGVTLGPCLGLTDMDHLIHAIDKGGATAYISHKGVYRASQVTPKCGFLLHLSASTLYSSTPFYKSTVATVEEGLRLGADGISVHINLGGSPREAEMLTDLGKIAQQCDEWQIPLLVMVYPRGPKMTNPPQPADYANIVRMVGELGADLVKTNYTGSIKSFRKVVEGSLVPVLIAGGAKSSQPRDILQMVYEAMEAGAAGVSLGRNIFQAASPENMTQALYAIIFEEATVEQALKYLKS